MACKVEYKDLEEITKFLDKIYNDKTKLDYAHSRTKARILSQKIKDKYTEIKPDYDRID